MCSERIPMTKHTPLPWVVDGDAVITQHATKRGGYQMDGTPRVFIASMEDLTISGAERAANAAFIVRACNAHDDLLDVCVDVDALFLLGGELDVGSPLYAALRAVIAKARGL